MAKEQPIAFHLSAPDRAECKRVAQLKLEPHSQRANALLLIESGLTHREAGAKSGLSIGQVRYALNRFRKFGSAMFPPPPLAKKKTVKQEISTEEAKPASKKLKKEKKKKKRSKKSKKENEKKKGPDSKKKKKKKKNKVKKK